MSSKQRSTKRLKASTSASLGLFITQRLSWQRGDGEWEHFKDQTFCHGLRGQPDSLLLSAMRGSSGWWWEAVVGGGQRHRRTLFSILLRFCRPPCTSQSSDVFLGCLKGMWSQGATGLAWLTEEGSGLSNCVGGMMEEGDWERKQGREGGWEYMRPKVCHRHTVGWLNASWNV